MLLHVSEFKMSSSGSSLCFAKITHRFFGLSKRKLLKYKMIKLSIKLWFYSVIKGLRSGCICKRCWCGLACPVFTPKHYVKLISLKEQNAVCIEWFPLAIKLFTGLISEVIITYHKRWKHLDPFWLTSLAVKDNDLRCWSPQERVCSFCALCMLLNQLSAVLFACLSYYWGWWYKIIPCSGCSLLINRS